MSGFAREWVRFLFGVMALALVSICAREAKAFPGPLNINNTVGDGYITSGEVDSDPVSAAPSGCISCHGFFVNTFVGETWSVLQLAPALTISGPGTSTTHATNSDGNGGIFTVQPNTTSTLTLTFKTLTVPGGSGGFLVYHKDGTSNSSGTLSPIGSGEHSCRASVPDAECDFEISGDNTEVMHAVPQVTANGNISFSFGYTAPPVCSGSFGLRLWFNAEDGNSDCGTPDSSYFLDFTINIGSCSDNNACNGVETCNAFFGSCFGGTPVTCNAPPPCRTSAGSSCAPASGACTYPPNTGAACDDGNACTTGTTCSIGATCGGGSATPVDDGNPCTADACTPGGGITHTPLTGNACDDGNPCTTGTTCSSLGACGGGSATNIDDGNTCTTDTCTFPGAGIQHAKLTGPICSDGNSCTNPDTCQAGVCQSGPGMVCPAPDQCHTAVSCSGGTCPILPAKPNGTACNDNNNCTTGDTCQGGTCTGGPAPNCNDGLPCSTDTCNPGTGPGTGCVNTAVPAGTQCSAASCVSGTATPRENCNGSAFTCPTATPVSCGGAVCAGTGCAGGCNGDDSLCTAGNFCSPANVCQPKKPDGGTCSADNACTNGHCVDGICCNTACGRSNGIDNPNDCQACTTGVCTIPVGTVCRPADPAKACDAPEVCTVAGGTVCPADLPVAAAANKVCRASADLNLCDPAETCDGTSFTCPANAATRDGVECRRSAGACDPHETCLNNACPSDVHDTTSVCRPIAAGTNCDVQEVCGTNGVNCPADGFKASNISCRAASCSSGTGTIAASCSGSAASCPAVVNKDCTPYVCQGTACGTSCTLKTDCDVGFYCNAAKTCVPELPPGGACTTAESCGTGICVDGRCCNSQCNGQCQACDVPGKPGICSPVPATDKVPHGARPKCGGDATVCHGFCDGTNTASCALPGATTQCLAPSCTAGVATPAEFCNGSGTCPTQANVPCTPGICQAATGPKAICVGGGGTPCVSDVECLTGNYCLVGKCKPKNGNGSSCSADDQCTNGHCVDGLCCNSSCDGQCEACDVTGKPGVCSPIPASNTPHSGRQACTSDPQFLGCAGQCDGKNRLSCVYPGAGTSCRDASCTNDIATLPAYCTGTGTCSPPQQQACDSGNGCNMAGTICKNGCSADRDCSIGKYCSGGVCVPTVAQGDPCSTSGQCAGACVDGVCCNTTCDHQCEACNLPNKLGICTAVTGAPVLPRTGCSTDGTAACVGKCNGVNRDACTFPGSTTQCSAGSCADGVATLTDFCDGAGSCPAAQHQICAPDDCSGTKCGGACAVSGTCPTGQYCSGGECVTKLPPKSVCNLDSDCANGICTDGFCCDSACTGQCQACDVPGSQGVCTTIAGDAPHGGRAACPGFGPCGALCDGTSPTQCTPAAATTTCGKSTCAGDGEQLSAPLCNGAGACLPAVGVNCGAYTCDPSSGTCQTTCVIASDCAVGFDCVNAKCVVTNDAGVVDSGAGGASDMPDASTDASTDGMAPDATTDGASPDSGSAGESDGGPVLVPPNHSTDKGSCGCRVPGSESGHSNGLLFAAALTLLGAAGRRRRGRTASRSEREARP